MIKSYESSVAPQRYFIFFYNRLFYVHLLTILARKNDCSVDGLDLSRTKVYHVF